MCYYKFYDQFKTTLCRWRKLYFSFSCQNMFALFNVCQKILQSTFWNKNYLLLGKLKNKTIYTFLKFVNNSNITKYLPFFKKNISLTEIVQFGSLFFKFRSKYAKMRTRNKNCISEIQNVFCSMQYLCRDNSLIVITSLFFNGDICILNLISFPMLHCIF